MTLKLQKIIQKFGFLVLFIVGFLIAFSLEPISDIFSNYQRILTSSSVLLSDYLYIGGLSATIINVLLTTGLNLLILKALRVKMNGAIFACMLTIAGFAFFGKNLYNALPVYLGIFLYCKATRTPCKDHVLVFLLSSGISPITSFLIFGAGFQLVYGLIFGISVGIIVGFILPAFNVFSMKFHQGYNLYNTGFSMGVISMILTGVLGSFGVDIIRSSELNNSYHFELYLTVIIISTLFIMFAFVENKNVLRNYTSIFKSSGKLMTDFTLSYGKDVTLLNLGFMGLIISILIYVMGIQINGPVMGAILTVIGFSAFGKHPLNSIPVIIGAILAIELTPLEWTIGSSLSVIFVTGLAPIAGQFGIVAGILAGFIHLMITPLALNFQGGFDLYNNGFAAGFVCALLAPIYSVIFKKRDEHQRWNVLLPLNIERKKADMK
ncbi:MAG: DUF1576 domain-containing protein [Acholeplasmataceae bacterium]|nr:DUF1576 domain-containing protein [Acholeplasmataceae bacterium]